MNERNKLKDEVWLNVASEISRLSKDENTKIGSVIVNKNGKVVSTGYNGGAPGINDNRIPHSREKKSLAFNFNGNLTKIEENKYPFMIHAERNAISACTRPEEMKDSTIYVTAMPCTACAWEIVRHGIKRVVISPQKEIDPNSSVGDSLNLSLFMFAEGNVEVFIGETKLDIQKID